MTLTSHPTVSLQNSDMYRTLNNQRVELLARISALQHRMTLDGTPVEMTRDEFWLKTWQHELNAVMKCLWVLGDQA